ncbi:hypothetical protein [Clostridium sp. UBA7503]
MSTGVDASIVNVAQSLGLNARTISNWIHTVANETSRGTISACAPIFL